MVSERGKSREYCAQESIVMKSEKSVKELHHLKKDPVMKTLIECIGPLEFHVHQQDLFAEIVDSIISQQLSGKVAKVIYSRFENLFTDKNITPIKLLAIEDEKLRAVGMSWAKVKYIKDLAQKALDGTLQLHLLNTMKDADVVEHLVQVKGVGPWTAQMILMFSLNRPDILPLDDLGIQVAFEKLYHVKRENKKKMIRIAEAWRPHRTLACRYLWKSLDNE